MGQGRQQMMLIIMGVLVLVFGLLLADVVIDAAVVALTNAAIGSFTGAASVGGLIPFVYFTVLILVAVGLMGIGAKGLAGGLNIVALPVALPMFTEVPVTVALIGVLTIGAVYSYNKYRESRAMSQGNLA